MDRKAGDLEKLKQQNDALAERLQELEKTVRALAPRKD